MVKIEKFEAGSATAGPYSPCIKVGDMIYISGQVGIPGDVQEQTNRAFEKIKTLLEAAGTKVSSIVKVNVYLKNIGDFKLMNQSYMDFFKANSVETFPARTTVEVSNLPIREMLVEIDCVAVI